MALTAQEIARKAKNRTLTIGEALEYGIANPKTSQGVESPAAAKRMQALLNTGLKQMGLEPSMPYWELSEPDIYKRFAVERDQGGKKTSASYVYAGQTLEFALDPVFETYGVRGFTTEIGDGLEKALYPRIFGRSGVSGLTQRSGLGGARPMQGTITRKEMDEIYANGYAGIDTAGEPKAQILKDGMDYHRATANRLDHLFGTGGLKKNDITLVRDENNNVVKVIVAEKVTTEKDHKGRNQMTYPADSRLGQIILRNYESSPNQYVFDLTDGEYEAAFDKYLSPEFLKHKEKLPFVDLVEGKTNPEGASRISSASVVRSAVPRMLNAEFKVPQDMRQAIMGQKGGETLNRNYEGIVVDEELGSIAEMYAFGDPRKFSGPTGAGQADQKYQGFTFELSEEARKLADDRAKAESEAGTQEALARAATAKIERAKGEKAYFDWLESEEGQEYQRQLESEEIRKAEAKGKADAARAAARKDTLEEERARTSRINDPDPEEVDEDDINTRFQELANRLLDMKALTRVEVVDTKRNDDQENALDALEGTLELAGEQAKRSAAEEETQAGTKTPPRLKDLVRKGAGFASKAIPAVRMIGAARTISQGIQEQFEPSKPGEPITGYDIVKGAGEAIQGFISGPSEQKITPTVKGPSMSEQYQTLEDTNNFLNQDNGENR